MNRKRKLILLMSLFIAVALVRVAAADAGKAVVCSTKPPTLSGKFKNLFYKLTGKINPDELRGRQVLVRAKVSGKLDDVIAVVESVEKGKVKLQPLHGIIAEKSVVLPEMRLKEIKRNMLLREAESEVVFGYQTRKLEFKKGDLVVYCHAGNCLSAPIEMAPEKLVDRIFRDADGNIRILVKNHEGQSYLLTKKEAQTVWKKNKEVTFRFSNLEGRMPLPAGEIQLPEKYAQKVSEVKARLLRAPKSVSRLDYALLPDDPDLRKAIILGYQRLNDPDWMATYYEKFSKRVAEEILKSGDEEAIELLKTEGRVQREYFLKAADRRSRELGFDGIGRVPDDCCDSKKFREAVLSQKKPFRDNKQFEGTGHGADAHLFGPLASAEAYDEVLAGKGGAKKVFEYLYEADHGGMLFDDLFDASSSSGAYLSDPTLLTYWFHDSLGFW